MGCWWLRRRIRDALHLFSCPRWPTLIRRPEVPCTPEKGSDRPCTSSLARIGDTAQSVRASDTSDCRYQHPPAMAAKFRSSPYERIYLFVLLLICFTVSPEVSGYSRTKVQGCPHGSPYEAADSAVHRGDRGALIEGTPNCGLPASPNHPRGFSPRFYHSFREACGSSQRQPSCTSGLSCSLDRRRSAIQPLSGWLIGALVPTARLHSHGRAGGL